MSEARKDVELPANSLLLMCLWYRDSAPVNIRSMSEGAEQTESYTHTGDDYQFKPWVTHETKPLKIHYKKARLNFYVFPFITQLKSTASSW